MRTGNLLRRGRLSHRPGRALALAASVGFLALPALATANSDATFVGRVAELSAAQKKAMTGPAFREGCPVPLEDLRSVHITYVDAKFGRKHGHLVVHKDIADDVLEVFKELYVNEYPITSILPIEHFKGSDDDSMAANNTSSFNCRDVTGKPGTWSNHSYGRAIDLNPQINPYMLRGKALPPNGAPYADRNVSHPMLIKADGPVVKAFKKRGFTWGGDWKRVKDYQHFEKQSKKDKERRRP